MCQSFIYTTCFYLNPLPPPQKIIFLECSDSYDNFLNYLPQVLQNASENIASKERYFKTEYRKQNFPYKKSEKITESDPSRAGQQRLCPSLRDHVGPSRRSHKTSRRCI